VRKSIRDVTHNAIVGNESLSLISFLAVISGTLRAPCRVCLTLALTLSLSLGEREQRSDAACNLVINLSLAVLGLFGVGNVRVMHPIRKV